MPTDWTRTVKQDRIKVHKASFPFRHTWEVTNGGQGIHVRTWREAIDIAIRWAYTGQHP